jgi:hypothetical protein
MLGLGRIIRGKDTNLHVAWKMLVHAELASYLSRQEELAFIAQTELCKVRSRKLNY